MADTFDDGGPAFPTHSMNVPFADANNPKYFGMSLRDYFAAVALQGLIASEAAADGTGAMQITKGIPKLNAKAEDFALMAYSLADAMLDVRSKTTPE